MDSLSFVYDEPAQMYNCKLYLARKLSNNRMFLICNGLSYGNSNLDDATPFLHIRALALAGVKRAFIVTLGYSANQKIETGSVCNIIDHMPVFVDNPLVGPNVEKWGNRFPDISKMYTNSKLMFEGSNVIPVTAMWTNMSKPYAYDAEFGMAKFMGIDIVVKQGVGECMMFHHMGVKSTVIAVIESSVKDSCPSDLLGIAEKNSSLICGLISDL